MITEIVRLKLEIVRVRAKCITIENETIERCAKVADRTPYANRTVFRSARDIAAAIRALKRESG